MDKEPRISLKLSKRRKCPYFARQWPSHNRFETMIDRGSDGFATTARRSWVFAHFSENSHMGLFSKALP
jgi:hypothetical protein